MQDAEGTASRAAHAKHQGIPCRARPLFVAPHHRGGLADRRCDVLAHRLWRRRHRNRCQGEPVLGRHAHPPGRNPTIHPGGTPTIDPGGSSGETGGATGGSDKAVEAKTGKASNGSNGSSSARRCANGHLGAAWSTFQGSPDMDYDGQQTARVVLTNTGTSGCTLAGFPGVQLQTTHGSTWDLRRSNKKPESVRLDAGEKAVFDITFLASTREDDRKFAPNQIVITPPPNERRNIVLDWPYGGALLEQSGATRPGTFVGPVAKTEWAGRQTSAGWAGRQDSVTLWSPVYAARPGPVRGRSRSWRGRPPSRCSPSPSTPSPCRPGGRQSRSGTVLQTLGRCLME
ncbi:DUF4232 domain-containing protein [Streptomyces olivaceiscleroticus]|uniref:DUF4232 domain-containing protein n=1 Tax=Streptomyces olivaceiscleroticus TaxID=68245 RepID=A0ABN0ZL89_9ACTN